MPTLQAEICRQAKQFMALGLIALAASLAGDGTANAAHITEMERAACGYMDASVTGEMTRLIAGHGDFERITARVRNTMGGMTDANPLRFRIQQAGPFEVFSRLRGSPLLISLVVIGGVVLLSAVVVFGFRPRHMKTETKAMPRPRASFASQLLGTSIQGAEDQSPLELGIRGRPSVQVANAQLIASYLLLNEEPLDIRTPESPELSAEAIATLRSLLLEEHKHPLDAETERRIDVSIEYVASETHKHLLNFYYRVGNNRATHHSFEESIDEAIWWHRFIASRLRSAGTAPTPVRETVAVDVVVPVQPRGDTAAEGPINPNLADELERLVKLKQEGLLSEEEFAVAKAKLLE